MEAKSEKLTTWQKIGYGLGDIYGGGSGVVISFYYLIFLTDVVRISPALAGTVILISKIYDSITDPFEGIIADRTRTKLGRQHPPGMDVEAVHTRACLLFACHAARITPGR